MDNSVIHVPVTLLLDRGQNASAKVVWMARRMHSTAGPAELERRTGLSRHTILNAARVMASRRLLGGPRVKVPAALLSEPAVGAQAKVLFGLLQATPDFQGQGGQFTYASLCSLTNLGRNTVKRAMSQLAGAGWVEVTQESPFSPIHFTIGNHEWTRSQAEAVSAVRRLKRAKFVGEAIMQEYLSLLIDSDQFTDNARPGFLVSPLTGERLELDRFYLPNVAFETVINTTM